MTSAEVFVKPDIIEWVLEQSPEIRLDETMQENAAKWISGEKTPTLRQIEAFSAKLHLPLGYFFPDSPPMRTWTTGLCTESTGKRSTTPPRTGRYTTA